MTLPREVIPGRFYMITRRCTQRQFLLHPDAETNNAFTYCLAEAALRFEIEILLPSAMSNHHHTVVYDRHGRIPQFTEHFHKMLAKCLNALRGRWENLWSSEQVCVVRLVDKEDVVHKLVYAATNPVKDMLVEKVHHWPGVNGLRALLSGCALRARRPRHFFRAGGVMPDEVTLPLVIPPELGDADLILSELRARVEEEVARISAQRMRSGARIVGRRAIRQQSWRLCPRSREPRRNLRPTVAARSHWSRIEALQRNQEFLMAYREAREGWLADRAIPFPAGTYWLRRFMHVPLTT